MRHLDTSTVVAFLRGDTQVAERIAQYAPALGISAIVMAELEFGARISARPEANLSQVRALRTLLPVAPFDGRAAEAYGEIRAGLRKRGLQTGEVDALIAAIALSEGASLVTHNVKHFENIGGLKLEDWVSEQPDSAA